MTHPDKWMLLNGATEGKETEKFNQNSLHTMEPNYEQELMAMFENR